MVEECVLYVVALRWATATGSTRVFSPGANTMSAPSSLTHAGLQAAVAHLVQHDTGLAAIVEAHGAPPMWDRPRGFATLVQIILEQQVSLQSAATLYARVALALGAVTPATVTACGVDGLRANGLTRQKAAYVVALAQSTSSGALPLQYLHRYSDDAAAQLLTRVPGIGPWSASVYQLMVLKRADIWPPGDLALHKAMQNLRGLAVVPTSAEATAFASVWSPFRAVAARILWHGYLEDRAALSRMARVRRLPAR